jgi:cardiolipin synthase A/B
MKLIIEPDDGVWPLLTAIQKAKKTIDVAIFRFDRADVARALAAAVQRGVKVNALVAFRNRGGQENLRKLEMRCLQAGITVSRTADDLTRYHGKFIVIDRRVLCVLSFNFTHVDIDRSRGFGVITSNSRWVQEAAKLFEADRTRSEYRAGQQTFVVSPANSRKALGDFLRHAHKRLLIYDPEISDKEMLRILNDRRKSGLEIRVIGEIDSGADLSVVRLAKMRLHTHTIIRDDRQAFLGSQSLRTAELDSRREVGLIVRQPEVVRRLVQTFESDWESADKIRTASKAPQEPKLDTEKIERVLVEELHPIAVAVKKAVNKVVQRAGEEALEDETVKDTVKKVVKDAVKEAVKTASENNGKS